MATAVGVYCNVCWEIHDVHSIYVLPCGHGYCASVLKNQTRKPPQQSLTMCPHCKQQFKSTTKRRLFLDLRVAEDSSPITAPSLDSGHEESFDRSTYSVEVQVQAQRAAEGIRKLEKDSGEVSIRRAAIEITKVLDKMESDGRDKVQVLLSAMSAFVTRVAPLWGLQKQVTALRKGMLDRQIEIERLKEEATNAQRIAEDAVDTADRATREHCNVQREMDALRARLAQCEEDGREKSNTISRLQDSVTTFKRRETRHLASIKELEGQLQEHRDRIARLEEASTTAAEEKLALESQLQMSQAAFSDSAPDTSDDFDDMYLDLVDLDSQLLQSTQHTSHMHTSDHRAPLPTPPPQRPRFGSGWNLKPPATGKRKREPELGGGFTIAKDGRGHPLKPIALGSRVRLQRHN